jgi:hypothetical protein
MVPWLVQVRIRILNKQDTAGCFWFLKNDLPESCKIIMNCLRQFYECIKLL